MLFKIGYSLIQYIFSAQRFVSTKKNAEMAWFIRATLPDVGHWSKVHPRHLALPPGGHVARFADVQLAILLAVGHRKWTKWKNRFFFNIGSAKIKGIVILCYFGEPKKNMFSCTHNGPISSIPTKASGRIFCWHTKSQQFNPKKIKPKPTNSRLFPKALIHRCSTLPVPPPVCAPSSDQRHGVPRDIPSAPVGCRPQSWNPNILTKLLRPLTFEKHEKHHVRKLWWSMIF